MRCPVLTSRMLLPALAARQPLHLAGSVSLSSYALAMRCPELTYPMLVKGDGSELGLHHGSSSLLCYEIAMRCPVLRQDWAVPGAIRGRGVVAVDETDSQVASTPYFTHSIVSYRATHSLCDARFLLTNAVPRPGVRKSSKELASPRRARGTNSLSQNQTHASSSLPQSARGLWLLAFDFSASRVVRLPCDVRD
eukprot:1639079-Rhodomonas_salina.3